MTPLWHHCVAKFCWLHEAHRRVFQVANWKGVWFQVNHWHVKTSHRTSRKLFPPPTLFCCISSEYDWLPLGCCRPVGYCSIWKEKAKHRTREQEWAFTKTPHISRSPSSCGMSGRGKCQRRKCVFFQRHRRLSCLRRNVSTDNLSTIYHMTAGLQ